MKYDRPGDAGRTDTRTLTLMLELAQTRIVLGLTGGVACYKSAELLRRLQAHGAQVDVVMTEAATHFITPTTMQSLSGRPVWVDAWATRAQNSMAHITLTDRKST